MRSTLILVVADLTGIVTACATEPSIDPEVGVDRAADRGLVGVGIAPPSLASTPMFSGLGPAPGSSSSQAWAVSADGSVVVGNGESFLGDAFRWTATGGMQTLGTFHGGSFSFGRGVSDDGSVAVGSSQTASGPEHAFGWTSKGGMAELGVLPPGASLSLAQKVNADGSVIVGDLCGRTGCRAFRWSKITGMVSLGTLPGGGASFGSGVNADGSVVVGDSFEANGVGFQRDVAFRWTRASGMQSLGTFPRGTFSIAYAVSADGEVVIGDGDSPKGDIAFRWTASGGMTALGTLPGPFEFMESNCANADGSTIVGDVQGSGVGGNGIAFLWTNGAGIVDLNELLPELGIDLTGWTLTNATSITPDARTIVGYGLHDSAEEAWIVTSAIGF